MPTTWTHVDASSCSSQRGWVQHLARAQEAGRDGTLTAAELARSIDGRADRPPRGSRTRVTPAHWAVPPTRSPSSSMREGLAGVSPTDLATRADTMASLAHALVLVPGDEALTVAEEAERLARDAGADAALSRAILAAAWALRSRGRGDGAAPGRGGGCGPRAAPCPGRLGMGVRYLVVEGSLRARRPRARTRSRSSSRTRCRALFRAGDCRCSRRPSRSSKAGSRGCTTGSSRARRWEVRSATRTRRSAADSTVGPRWCKATSRKPCNGARGWRGRCSVPESASTLRTSSPRPVTSTLRGPRTPRRARDIRPLAPQLLQQWTLAYEAVYALRTGDAAIAARLTVDLEPFRNHFLGGDTTLLGAAEGAMARAAIVEGRFADAVELAEHTLAAAAQRGWHTLATQHRVDLSRALLGRAGPGDTDRAGCPARRGDRDGRRARPRPRGPRGPLAPGVDRDGVRGGRGPRGPGGRGSGSGCGPRARATRGARTARSPC